MRVPSLFLIPCLVSLLAHGRAPAQAPAFAAPERTPLAKELAGAHVVVFGMLYNAEAGANQGRGTTEVAVLAVIKDHEALKDKKHFSLKRQVPAEGNAPKYFVLFGEVFKGEIDVYRALPCSGKDNRIVEYLRNVGKQQKASRVDQLAFCFGYLEGNRDVAEDAFSVFSHATYAELKLAAGRFDLKKLEGWLADKSVPEHRKELYRVLVILGERGSDR
jgi:hypothetical protein